MVWAACPATELQKPRYEQAPYTGIFFADLKAGLDRDALEAIYGPVIDWTASSIRHFLSGPLLDADYSAIEARILAWMAGEEWMLRAFREGRDLYMRMASKVYGIPEEELDRKLHRQLGKVTILGCGYKMWWKTFREHARGYGLELSKEDAKNAVITYRDSCPSIVGFWAAAAAASSV